MEKQRNREIEKQRNGEIEKQRNRQIEKQKKQKNIKIEQWHIIKTKNCKNTKLTLDQKCRSED